MTIQLFNETDFLRINDNFLQGIWSKNVEYYGKSILKTRYWLMRFLSTEDKHRNKQSTCVLQHEPYIFVFQQFKTVDYKPHKNSPFYTNIEKSIIVIKESFIS